MRILIITLALVTIGHFKAMAQPSNDNCSSATVLTIDTQDCAGTTSGSSLESGECFTDYGGGSTEHSTWYRVTALNDSLVFSVAKTNATNCVSPHVSIYGPFAPGGGCQPACGSQIYNQLHNGDPGVHILQTGLSIGSDYLIQVVDLDCGGPNDGHVEYCVGVYNPAINSTSSGAEGIDACGVTYNGTNIGYYPTNGATGLENLDGNAGTTCPTCTAGDDVSYVVNNDSWFYFCATAAGSWNVNFSGISNCTNATTSDGLQMTIFSGTPTNLTQIWNSINPSQPGSSQTSATFSLAAGECAYMVVDGFAGDQCDYSYTLNNITGGCNLLPLPAEFGEFIGYNNGQNVLRWSTLSEINASHYVISRSINGNDWSEIIKVPANGNSTVQSNYSVEDRSYARNVNYYMLSQYDIDGMQNWSKIITIDNSVDKAIIVKTINTIGQEVDSNYIGIVFDILQDGTAIKRFNN